MDDKSWNDYLIGRAGGNTGSIMNEIGRGTVNSPSKQYYPTTSSNPDDYYIPPEPPPLTEADKRRIEAGRLRQNRLDALPPTSVYRKWSARFGTLEYWVDCTWKYVLGSAILIALSSFIALGLWGETSWTEFLRITMFSGLIILPVALYIIYAVHLLSEHGINPVKTLSVLSDFQKWTLPFRVIYAAFQTIVLFLLLVWPLVTLWYIGPFFAWW
jgi:hypothetical protein